MRQPGNRSDSRRFQRRQTVEGAGAAAAEIERLESLESVEHKRDRQTIESRAALQPQGTRFERRAGLNSSVILSGVQRSRKPSLRDGRRQTFRLAAAKRTRKFSVRLREQPCLRRRKVLRLRCTPLRMTEVKDTLPCEYYSKVLSCATMASKSGSSRASSFTSTCWMMPALSITKADRLATPPIGRLSCGRNES